QQCQSDGEAPADQLLLNRQQRLGRRVLQFPFEVGLRHCRYSLEHDPIKLNRIVRPSHLFWSMTLSEKSATFRNHSLGSQPASGGVTPAKNSQEMISPTQITKPNRLST